MPKINLIESDILAARKIEAQIKVSRFTFLGTLGVIGLLNMGLLGQVAAANSEKNDLQKQQDKQRPLLKKIDEFKKEESELAPRLKTLQGAQDLTGRWGKVLQHLTINTPSDVWLTSVRATMLDPEKPIHITFGGVGRNQTLVSEMMLRLQNSPELETVSLVRSSEKVLEKTAGIEFEIGGDIVGTVEKKPKKVEEEGEKKEGGSA